MQEEEIYYEARKKVKAKKGFFHHLIAYIGVTSMLAIIMRFENGGNLLPVMIVALSWGIGLAAHYLNAFGTEHLEFLGFNPNWEEEELEKELERIKYKKALKEQIFTERNQLEEVEGLELKEIQKTIEPK